MAKVKTSKKPRGSLKTSTRTKVKGLKFYEFDPVKWFVENPETVFEGLTQALREGDKEAFQEILEGYVKAKNILNISKVTKLSRATIYEAIDKTKNPSLATICKIMAAFEKAS